jgi:metallo-beta-lactamase family protein
MATLTFLGAARCVTGSKYLVEANGRRLLVDCGLFQGPAELRELNWQPLPVPPDSLDWVVLTHAHLDHTGYLPRLVRDGYEGPILANAATRDLCALLLPDSAHLQEEDAAHAARKGYGPPHPPLYTVAEAQTALQQFQIIPRSGPYTISEEFSIRLYDAGHILGSAIVELTVREKGRSTVVVFSGDIGRYGQPILKDPTPVPAADLLLCESTYGDRDHPRDDDYVQLSTAIRRTADRGGVVVVPAFAVGRTQTLLYVLRELEERNLIPHLPVYLDSPMAISVTDLYEKHHEDHNLTFVREEKQFDPLNTREVHMTRSVEESKRINEVHSPAIIIAGSGMATGGRVQHHLQQRLPDPRNAVLLVGFQAEGTPGRALLDGARSLHLHGQDIPVRAEVIELPQFSAHADRNELLRWLGGFTRPPARTFVVHGEPGPAMALSHLVKERLGWSAQVPTLGERVDLA